MEQLESSRSEKLYQLRRFTIATKLSQILDTTGFFITPARPAVLVTGFWRSGTTWMQQYLAAALDAKTVFEPLSPVNVARERMLIDKGISCFDLREAQIPGPSDSDICFWKYLDRAFQCRQLSAFELICRTRISDSLRHAVVVKDVRMQLNLHAAHLRYGVPVVHMRRHPCAVVSSLLAAKNWSWSFARTRLCDVLEPLRQVIASDGKLAHIDFDEFDDGVVSRIAAYWSVTEVLAEKSLNNQKWAIVVPYEEAVKFPELYLRAICEIISFEPTSIPCPHFDSWSTHDTDRETPDTQRPRAWHDRISTHDKDRVLDIVSVIFPTCYYLNE
jgi:hypothetical protein